MAKEEIQKISTDGWVGNPDLITETEDVAGDGRRFFGLQSYNLARRIFFSSFIALSILLIGALFLSQPQGKASLVIRAYLEQEADFQKTLLETRIQSSGQISKSSDFMKVMEDTPAFKSLSLAIYSENIQLIEKHDSTIFDDLGFDDEGEVQTRNTGAFTKLLNFFRSFGSNEPFGSIDDFQEELARLAQTGDTSIKQAAIDEGKTVLGVAREVSINGQTLGYLVISTPKSLVGSIVQTRIKGLLSFFVLALLAALFFAIVLARTVTNPLNDLARAAEIGTTADLGQKDARKVLIPDMAGRSDVIGRLSAAMGEMTHALYNRIETNESFAADVAHEIKNPLASMRSAVETLRVAKEGSGRRELLDILEMDVQRLDRLVSDISNASRLDAELVSEETERFLLNRMLENIVEFHRIEAGNRKIEMYWEGPAKPIYFDGLEERLAQVFVNLVTNAISFCQEGDAIRVWTRLRDNRILAVVEDTGPGIPEQSLDDIFRRFYSQRPTNDFGNHSGLGLAISKQIVEAHGGTIWAENIRNEDANEGSEVLGARFVVALPA